MVLLLLEDNEAQAVALKEIINEYKPDWSVIISYTYENAIKICTKHTIDMFLLDIELGTDCNKTGLDFAEEMRIKKQYSHIPIIFITAYDEQIYKAINAIHCYNYIIKPYSRSSIHKAIDDFEDSIESKIDYINIKDASGVFYTLYYKDILYIEAASHNTIFHTVNGAFVYNRHSLTDTLYELDDRFIRVHKKYIVNCDYIKNYDKTTLKINVEGSSISVGRQYKTNFETEYKAGVLAH